MRMLPAIVRLLGAPLERADDPAAKADAVVILGSRLRPDGSLSEIGAERMRAGIDVWRRGLAPVMCVTGGFAPFVREKIPEAEAMARAASAGGVPESALRVESKSRSTYENARLCAEILLPQHRRIWLVTQPFHSRRAARQFHRAGFEVLVWKIEDSLQYRDARWGLARVLREYISWVKALVRR